MRKTLKSVFAIAAAAASTLVSFETAWAQKRYDVGATDTEIKLGNIMPYSGPASAYSVLGKIFDAYFKMINDRGGINGRKISFISYDDGYSPPKAVEQTRKLVESDEVFIMFAAMGTAPNVATQKYLNAKGIPHLFLASGATRWGDPKHFPWTMGWIPPFQGEARIYAKYIIKEKPDAKIAVIYQDDDLGRDYLKGLKDGLGGSAASILAEESHETSEPTIDSHIVKLKASGADTLVIFTTPKFAAQTIRKTAELNWKPLQIVPTVSGSVGAVMKPAGIEAAQGIITATFAKDGNDPQWNNDEGMNKFYKFLEKYAPEANRSDIFVTYAYGYGQTLVEVLRNCGDDLTRANAMKQAASLKDFRSDILLPGITINTSPTDFYPIEQVRLMRFKGERWELFGDVLDFEIRE
ncbi:branched-chain amino acid transport system substrate-binding protein [Nitrobacteraceae bacterium AZCC 2161]